MQTNETIIVFIITKIQFFNPIDDLPRQNLLTTTELNVYNFVYTQ